MLAMPAMTTVLAGLPLDAANTTVVRERPAPVGPCGEQWGIMGMIRRVIVTPQRANRLLLTALRGCYESTGTDALLRLPHDL